MDIDLLIQRTQLGGAEGRLAANELLFHIAEEYRDRKLHKFFLSGIPFSDRDDIRQAFLIGCYEGIMEAHLDIGDPLSFILQKGIWAATDAIRRENKKELQQECLICQTVSKPHRVKGGYVCRQCGSEQVALRRRIIPNANILHAIDRDQSSLLILIEFRDLLTGRKRDVFNLILYGYDRDNCRNYLKEIGQILGISTTNVNLRLRQIREAWVRYQATI